MLLIAHCDFPLPLLLLRYLSATSGFANGNRTNLERRTNEGGTKDERRRNGERTKEERRTNGNRSRSDREPNGGASPESRCKDTTSDMRHCDNCLPSYAVARYSISRGLQRLMARVRLSVAAFLDGASGKYFSASSYLRIYNYLTINKLQLKW